MKSNVAHYIVNKLSNRALLYLTFDRTSSRNLRRPLPPSTAIRDLRERMAIEEVLFPLAELRRMYDSLQCLILSPLSTVDPQSPTVILFSPKLYAKLEVL